jgi:hypothetical protein
MIYHQKCSVNRFVCMCNATRFLCFGSSSSRWSEIVGIPFSYSLTGPGQRHREENNQITLEIIVLTVFFLCVCLCLPGLPCHSLTGNWQPDRANVDLRPTTYKQQKKLPTRCVYGTKNMINWLLL